VRGPSTAAFVGIRLFGGGSATLDGLCNFAVLECTTFPVLLLPALAACVGPA